MYFSVTGYIIYHVGPTCMLRKYNVAVWVSQPPPPLKLLTFVIKSSLKLWSHKDGIQEIRFMLLHEHLCKEKN